VVDVALDVVVETCHVVVETCDVVVETCDVAHPARDAIAGSAGYSRPAAL
jgi:hypothetical protein